MSDADCIEVPAPSGKCAFCAYLAGRRDYAIVMRSGLVAVLVTREPRGEPHALVVTERHCETILDITDEEAAQLMLATRNTARAIQAAYCRDGIAVWQNNGLSANQAIPHVRYASEFAPQISDPIPHLPSDSWVWSSIWSLSALIRVPTRTSSPRLAARPTPGLPGPVLMET